MHKLGFNEKKGFAKVKIESNDDLWYLTYIADNGDFLSGSTLRKVQKGSDEKSNQVKKSVFLKIKIEKIEFSRNSGTLRIGGPVVEGSEDVPRGSWHSFGIEPGSVLTIEKKSWLSYQKEKLFEACSSKLPPVLICVLDREEAYIALMKKYGYEILSSMKGTVNKKGFEGQGKGSFYSDVISNINELSKRHGAGRVILASPAFWKDEILKEIKDTGLKSIVSTATCSSVGKNGIDEVIRRPETAEALRQEMAAGEMALVDELLSEISKQEKATYGIDGCESAALSGAVEKLLVTDSLITEMREKDSFERLDSIMRSVDISKGSVTIVSSSHEGGKKLDGLGGIGAILRYRIS